MRFKNILIATYGHPEFFPPTLNAIDAIAAFTDQVTIVARNVKPNEWAYPSNTKLYLSGRFKSIRETEKMSTLWKVFSFFTFTFHFFNLLRKHKPEWVVCYDPIPLYAYRFAIFFLSRKPGLWYHNHDVYEIERVGKFSVSGRAVLSEQKYFDKIDLFTLPSKERIKHFPVHKLKGSYFVLPNYPSLKRMGDACKEKTDPRKELKLLYQGYIGDGHGLDEIIIFLNDHPDISLTLIGQRDNDYIEKLKSLIARPSQINILPPVAYAQLSGITTQYHVGLAIHKPVNTAFRTAAMASNKIYEYPAAGLAIIYYDDEHYKAYLGDYRWAFANDLSPSRLDEQLKYIRTNYDMLSQAAQEDFRNNLNYEKAFQPVRDYLFDKRDQH